MTREKILNMLRASWYGNDAKSMRRQLLLGHFFLTDDDKSKINMAIKELEKTEKTPLDPLVIKALEIFNGKLV